MTERKESSRPIIAVGVLIFNPEGKILLGKRVERFGEGLYALPGGTVEKNELFKEAASRETYEETGLGETEIEIGEFISVSYQSVFGLEGLTLGVKAYTENEPLNIAHDEIEDWKWYSLDELPEELFPPTKTIIDNYKMGVMRNP